MNTTSPNWYSFKCGNWKHFTFVIVLPVKFSNEIINAPLQLCHKFHWDHMWTCVSSNASPVLNFNWQSTEDRRDNHSVRHTKRQNTQAYTYTHTQRLPGAVGRPGSHHSAGQRHSRAAAESGSLCCTICAPGSPPRRARGSYTDKVSAAANSPTTFSEHIWCGCRIARYEF